MEFGLHSLPRQQLVTHAGVFVSLYISVKCALVCSECRGEDLMGAIMLPSLDLTMVSERHHDDGEAVDMFSQVMMVFLNGADKSLEVLLGKELCMGKSIGASFFELENF